MSELLFHDRPFKGSDAASSFNTATCSEAEAAGGDLTARLKHSATVFWSKPCNNTLQKDPSHDIPLRSILVTMPVLAAYAICRWYLLVEDMIGLRSLPPSAFETVDWMQCWP